MELDFLVSRLFPLMSDVCLRRPLESSIIPITGHEAQLLIRCNVCASVVLLAKIPIVLRVYDW